ncbi:glycosyltransferase [Thioalkalivibrio sp. ALJ24]|uniref:glycosyltransferase n=1 Tax=Thioalkalivibrio sp. ALJ24 TaxID=545276 RepID=UPI0009FC7CDC|nr:glycosyltransferase [Thioalkalivibrio sp. ALJ24]
MENRPVSFFIPGLNGGGAQKVVVNLANALVDLTDRPVHIVLARAAGEFLDEVRPEVEIVDLGKGRASRAIPALARYLRRVRPAVLCSSLNYANVCAAVAWQLAGRPGRLVVREDNVVREPGGDPRRFLQRFLIQRLMRACYPRTSSVVAISDAVAGTLVDRKICLRSHVRVIGNPIAITAASEACSSETPLPEIKGKRYICAIGRLTEQKGFDVLLEAYGRLGDGKPDLVILGEGPLRADLAAQADRLGVADQVHMPGFVSAPEKVLSSSALFVLSSRWEGFGNVLVEALATGAPVVSTDCPGAPRALLRDAELGHLVPVNEPDGLAAAITEALHSPRGTREARQERARDFAAPSIAREYMEVAFELEPVPSPDRHNV